MGLDLVIFDCDGVIVDSEPVSIGVLWELLVARGCQLELADTYELFMGKSQCSCEQIIEARWGFGADGKFFEAFHEAIFAEFRSSLNAVVGIRELLVDFPYRYCLASSGGFEKMDITLRKTKMYDFFTNKIFSAEQVKNGKPAPDLFLHACKEMGAPPIITCSILS